jgi:hypothetical protein
MLHNCFKATVNQPTGDIDVLIRHAEMARSKLTKFATALARELGLEDHNERLCRIKLLERIFGKAAERSEGDVRGVRDICAERILFSETSDIVAFRKLLAQGSKSDFYLKSLEKGVRIVEVEDHFAEPKKHGFIGININLEVQLGKGRVHIVELQLMHVDMVETDKVSHEIYEQIRSYDELASKYGTLTEDQKETRQSLIELNKRIYSEASERLGLGSLRVEVNKWKPDFGGNISRSNSGVQTLKHG